MVMKRLDLLDDASRRFVNVFLQDCPALEKPVRRRSRKAKALPAHSGRANNKQPAPAKSIEALAELLIEKRCGTHSLGYIYEFLLQITADAQAAQSEFVKFLSGEWSRRWVEAAVARVAEEQAGWPTLTSETLPDTTENDPHYQVSGITLSPPAFLNGAEAAST
jgi:hypothetical protein